MKKLLKKLNRNFLAFMLAFACTLSSQAQLNITIDGNADEAAWASAQALPMSKIIQQASKTGISGENDFSGTFKVLWDANNIYYYLEVKDDSSSLKDNFEIMFDLTNSKSEWYDVDSTVFDLGFTWQKNSWGGITGVKGGGEWGCKWSGLYTPDAADYKAIINEGSGYKIEWKIPVTAEAGVTLSANDSIGFDTKIIDVENSGQDQLAWNMSEDMGWHKPTFFGTLKLLADGNVEIINELPKIDGNAEYSWNKAAFMSMNKIIQQASKTGIANADDFSGKFKVLWDANNIYYYLEVKDDSSSLKDNFEIMLDLTNSKSQWYDFDSTVFDLGYTWQKNSWGGITGVKGGGEWGCKWSGLYTPDTIDYIATITPGSGYKIEWKIPVTIEAGITLTAGDTIGFDTKIIDVETSGQDQLAWNMSEDMGWHKPTFFGTLKLLADGTVEKVNIVPQISNPDDYAWNQTAYENIAKVIDLGSADKIKNDNDLSGKFKLLWDANNIYYLLEVKDDTIKTDAKDGYLNDNFGIYFDLKNTKADWYGSDNSDSTIFNFEYQWGNDVFGGRTANGTGGEWGGSWSSLFTPDASDYVATIDTGKGYKIVWKIPVTAEAGITLVAGNILGFDTKIADNDGTGRDQKSWNMSTDNAWHKPSTMGTIKLKEGGIVEFVRPLSNVADLASLEVSAGTLSPAFNKDSLIYTVELPAGTTTIPTITAKAVSDAAMVSIQTLTEIPGNDTIIVTAEDKITIKKVVIQFTIATGIKTTAESNISIFPNPIINELSVRTGEQINNISIYGIAGNLIKTVKLSSVSNATIDMSGLQPGTYMIRVSTTQNTITKTVIKK